MKLDTKNHRAGRTAIVINSLDGGGAEESMNMLFKSFINSGKEIFLISINESNLDRKVKDPSIIKLNRRYRSGAFETIYALMKFIYVVTKLHPKVVILNCNLPEFFGVFIPFPCKIIVVEHHPEPWPRFKYFGRFIRTLLYFRKSNWVRVSGHFKIWALPEIKSLIIPNMLNKSKIVELRNRQTETKIERLVYVGRFVEHKQLDWFIEIGNLLKLPVLLIGNGPGKNRIQDLIEDFSLKAEVQDFISNPWTKFLPTDLLLVPSKSEGDGLVIIEALLNNLPMMVRATKDFKRFRFDSNNYFKDPGEAVSKIITNKFNVRNFLVKDGIREEIIAARNEDEIMKKWSRVL